jgi:hypothetical protein
MGKINYLKEFRERFDMLRAEVGDYKPEIFEHLEKRFYECWENNKSHRIFVKRDLKSGKCPIREWLKAHYYPSGEFQKEFCQCVDSLPEATAKKFLDITKKYLFKLKNSKSFRDHCNRIDKHGGNSLLEWFNKYKFFEKNLTVYC